MKTKVYAKPIVRIQSERLELDSEDERSHDPDWVGQAYKSPHALVSIIDRPNNRSYRKLLHSPARRCCGETTAPPDPAVATGWTYQDLDEESFSEFSELRSQATWNQPEFGKILKRVAQRHSQEAQAPEEEKDRSEQDTANLASQTRARPPTLPLHLRDRFNLTVDDFTQQPKAGEAGLTPLKDSPIALSGYDSNTQHADAQPGSSIESTPASQARIPKLPSSSAPRTQRSSSVNHRGSNVPTRGRVHKSSHARRKSDLGQGIRPDPHSGLAGIAWNTRPLSAGAGFAEGESCQSRASAPQYLVPPHQADLLFSDVCEMDSGVLGPEYMLNRPVYTANVMANRRRSFQDSGFSYTAVPHIQSQGSLSVVFVGRSDEEINIDTLASVRQLHQPTAVLRIPPSALSQSSSHGLSRMNASPYTAMSDSNTFPGDLAADTGALTLTPSFDALRGFPMNPFMRQPTMPRIEFASLSDSQGGLGSLLPPMQGTLSAETYPVDFGTSFTPSESMRDQRSAEPFYHLDQQDDMGPA